MRRAIGSGTAVAIVVGYVIGSGIFLKPGRIAAEVGDFRIIIAAWVAGGALCLLGALSIAELAAMLPRAGGLYVYLREAYGRPVAFLFGWNEILFARPASLGALATAFVGSLVLALGVEVGGVGRAGLAISLIACVAWINLLGVTWGGRVQNATTLVKVGFLVMLATLPFIMMLIGDSPFARENFASGGEFEPRGSAATRFGVALLAVMWAYNGWHQITPVAEEIRQPQRSIPIALVAGVGILIVLYVSVNVAYHGVLSMREMAAAGEHAAEAVVRVLLGNAGAAAMAAVIMCSTLGAINGNLLVTPRVSFAMGRDGVFFRQLGQVHDRYRTPATAIVVQAAMAAVLVVASALVVEFAPQFRGESIFAMLTNFVVFSSSIFYMLGVASVVVLRRRLPDRDRPYRTWGYPFVPLAFVAGYAWFLPHIYIGKPFEANVGLALIAAGLPGYWFWRKRNLAASLPRANEP